MRLGLFLFVTATALTCTGCLRSTTVISVKPDGSGTVVQETGLSPQALAMLKSMAGPGTGANAKMPADIFGEDQAKQAADMMGVQFLSGEPIKTPELEGYRARFSFSDISKVRMKLNQNPANSMAGAAGAASADPPFRFGFEKRGSNSLLTITIPDLKANPMAKMPGAGAQSTPEQTQQAIMMMKAMLANMFVDVALDVDGRIVNTNAQHVQGSRITLLQIDMNALLADEAGLKKLQGATDVKGLTGINGLKMVSEPKLTVEFIK
jgi:hypothetical protein